MNEFLYFFFFLLILIIIFAFFSRFLMKVEYFFLYLHIVINRLHQYQENNREEMY